MVLRDLVRVVKFTGGIGVVGLYLPQDPGAPDQERQKGRITFEMGQFWVRANGWVPVRPTSSITTASCVI